MRYAFSRSMAGKAAAYIKRVTLDLVRVRRESGLAEKVTTIYDNGNRAEDQLY